MAAEDLTALIRYIPRLDLDPRPLLYVLGVLHVLNKTYILARDRVVGLELEGFCNFARALFCYIS